MSGANNMVMATHSLPPGSTSRDLQDTVNLAAFGDVIEISGDMPFTEAVTIPTGLEVTVSSAAGSDSILYHFLENTRHFEINGSLILENITLDGRAKGGGVQLNQGAFALMDGAAIQNCAAVNGGGVYVDRGVFSIYGGEIRQNTATNGGGLYHNSGLLNISASTGRILENKASDGGGIYINGGTFSLSGCDIIDNEATRGGGLYMNAGALEMERGSFSGNSATHGGGIFMEAAAALSITGSSSYITNNTASASGGGIYCSDTAYAPLSTGSGTVFRSNRAAAAYMPPAGAQTLYPDIKFLQTSIADHPLNNYDINYLGNTRITYHVTYDSNGGTGSHTGPETEPGGTDIVLSAEAAGVARQGYGFIGWNSRAGGGGMSFEAGDEITLNDSVTLYAQWTIELYTVTHDANGGTGGCVESNIPYGAQYRVLTPDEAGVANEGCGFVCWSTVSDGSGATYVPGDELTVNDHVTLYAQWVKNQYTVTYNANGGTGTCVVPGIIYGSKHKVLTAREARIWRKCYTLRCWNTQADGGGEAYAPGELITITRDVTLYAQWRCGESLARKFCREFCDEFCGKGDCRQECFCACEDALDDMNLEDFIPPRF